MEKIQSKSKQGHYGAINGLRTIAAIGIAMMHIGSNSDYKISGFIFDKVIMSFGNFVFLFMTVSAFGMCCGYYEKTLQNKISVSDFYSKRFKKIWPFFAILVLLDVIISPSLNAVYEAFADLTLLFGFLPNSGNITVIGVGWFIGLIFVFYLIFPFFCFLIANRRRAWLAFGISLIYNYVCANYFDVGRMNILYSGCFFLAGGLIYLYRKEIEDWSNKSKVGKWLALGFVALAVVIYYVVGKNTVLHLLVSVALLLYAVVSKDGGVLHNKVTEFFSSISMEMYLSHMVIFRVGERVHLNSVIGNGWTQYLFTVTWVIVGATVFSVVMQKAIKAIEVRI